MAYTANQIIEANKTDLNNVINKMKNPWGGGTKKK